MQELKKERPHIVFILADDLGWNEVFGQTFVIFASIITITHTYYVVKRLGAFQFDDFLCEFIAEQN